MILNNKRKDREKSDFRIDGIIIKFNKMNIGACHEENGSKTLEELLEERKKDSNYLSEDEILDYFSKILKEVKEIHDRNNVCGNLMPNNIILINQIPKINDFVSYR